MGAAKYTKTFVYERVFFFSSIRRHTSFTSDWSSYVCSSDLVFKIGEAIDKLPTEKVQITVPIKVDECGATGVACKTQFALLRHVLQISLLKNCHGVFLVGVLRNKGATFLKQGPLLTGTPRHLAFGTVEDE